MKREFIIIFVFSFNEEARENKEFTNEFEDDLLKDEPFRPGRIHEAKYFEFWRNDLKAGDWTLNVLENGYKLPFKNGNEPPLYEEKNNATAREDPETVEKLVTEMINLKIVRVVTERPHCVSPLGLVKRVLEDGTIKPRLVFDASRCLNEYLEEMSVKLSHLEKAVEFTEQNDLQSTFDLKSCYYHLRIYEGHQKFLGASFTNKRNEKIYFVYEHLPFGLAPAVHVITKIFKPLLAKIHGLGIKFSIYIDDGRFLAKTQEELEKNRRFIYELLKGAGWFLAKDKSDNVSEGGRRKDYLGFVIDTEKMKIEAPLSKIDKVKKMLQNALVSPVLRIKELAKVQGRIAALIPSHEFAARLSSRSGYALIEKHTKDFGWRGSVWIDQPTKNEWSFFIENIERLNGAPIRSMLNDVRMDELLPSPLVKTDRIPRMDPDGVMISDASGFKIAAYNLWDDTQEVVTLPLSVEERGLSSGLRELLAIEKTLEKWRACGSLYKNVYWCTDSANVVSFLSKGSSRPNVQERIFKVATLLSQLSLVLTPVHLLRMDERIQKADGLSKTRDSDDWSIDQDSFLILDKLYNFELDVFASNSNKRCLRFYSEFFEQESAGVEAFSQIWWPYTCWVCPPVKLLIKVAIRIRASKCKGVLVLPNWPTANYFTSFFDDQMKPRCPFQKIYEFHPFIHQNQGASSALKDKIVFSLVALYFQSNC